ncbi:unnamed protein product [Ceutorhynchus assimilis]|uniref:Uncharacterized protein n=1 Tax=Ceutorhynchus assimilis TaxID=467358 RepID=A0A9N9MX82_9CUCU|nr:unnamed protein product [Ceutorhynchus assimilis]CAG9772765.1 unnamed protein product [Ceutorhynchus assimilis]
MTRISVVNSFVLLLVFFYCATLEAESFDSPNDRGHREASPMWFGPRIGRKKRNDINKVYRNEKEQSLLDVLRESPLVVVAVNEESEISANKQHNFTPRLGRESGETAPNWLDGAELVDADQLSPRPSNPFSPRLGRTNYNPFSPRLGRESDVPLQ